MIKNLFIEAYYKIMDIIIGNPPDVRLYYERPDMKEFIEREKMYNILWNMEVDRKAKTFNPTFFK